MVTAHAFCFIPISFPTDLDIWPGIFLLLGTYIVFWYVHHLSNLWSFMEEGPLKQAVDIFIGLFITAEVLYGSTQWLFSWPYSINPLLLFGALNLLILWVCYIGSTVVRTKADTMFYAVFKTYVAAVERTVSLKFKQNSDFVGDEALILYHFMVYSGFSVTLTLCWYQPVYFQICLFMALCYRLFEFVYTEQYLRISRNSDYYTALFFDTWVVYSLAFSIFLGALVPMTVIFCGFVGLSYLEGVQNYRPELDAFKEACKKALPEINQQTLLTRFYLKLVILSFRVFPLYTSSYAHLLTFFFCISFVAKTLIFVYLWSGEYHEISEPLAVSSILYCGLYLVAFSAFLTLRYESTIYKDKEKGNDSTVALLIKLVGKDAVYGLGGNPLSMIDATGASHKKVGKFSLWAAVIGYSLKQAWEMVRTEHKNGVEQRHQNQRHEHNKAEETQKQANRIALVDHEYSQKRALLYQAPSQTELIQQAQQSKLPKPPLGG